MTIRHLLLTGMNALLLHGASAQCPQLYDYYGTPSSTPQWYSCSGSNFTLLIASPTSIGGYSINWGDGSPVQMGAALIPPMSVNHVYTSAVAEYTVIFTEAVSGCVITGTVVMEESTSASIQIPVGGLTQVCAPKALQFINSSTNTSPNTVFTWDFGDGSPLEVYDFTNLGQTVTHTYLQGTVNCETTVRLYAENNCNTLQGGPSIATFNPIRVWDLDDAAIAPSATLLCWPDNTVTFVNTTDRNCLNQGNIYQRFEHWNFGDYWGAGQDSIIDWSPWPPTFPRTISYPGIGSYDVTMLDSNYCGIDTATITINIVPPPSVSLVAMPAIICAGETIFFNQTTTGGANNHSWNFGDGGGWNTTGGGDHAHTYNTAGVFTVSYAASIMGASMGCSDTASVQVTVLPSPTAQFTLDNDAACTTLVTDPTNTSQNAITYLWDFGDGATDTQFDPPPHTYATVGDYTITLTATNADGCPDQATMAVHVYAPPQVVIGAQNVCVGDAAQFSDQSITAPGNPVVQWAWDFGDGTTSADQAPLHQYAGAGTFTVTLTVTTPYCSSTGTQQVSVQAKPTASFITTPIAGCSPMTVNFTNTSSGATNYIWDFGDGAGSTTTSPSHTYVNLGTADSIRTVTLIVSTPYGCSDTATVNITVSPVVTALFTNNAVPGCAPVDADFANNSVGATSYQWDFGDGATSTAVNPSHTFVNNTLFLQMNTVTLVAISAAGCTDTAQQVITVFPTANFIFVTDPDSGCSPFTTTFPPVLGAVMYDWDFGDGTTGSGAAPTHTYTDNNGAGANYMITLIAGNAFGCSDTLTAPLTVLPAPVAQFDITGEPGCHPLTATLTNTSLGASAYNWSYGDGASSTTNAVQHAHDWYNFQSTSPVSYPVTLEALSAAGCSSTAASTVVVYPIVTAQFTLPSEGCSPFTVNLSDQGSGAMQWTWDMGDGSVLAGSSITHTYVNTTTADQTFLVTLVSTSAYGCTDTVTHPIMVHPVPNAAFMATPFTQQFPASTVNINNTTASGPWTYLWDMGDDSTSTAQDPMTHTYATWGTFTMTLVVSNAMCTDTATQNVTITPPIPTASFIGQGEGCMPLTVQFTNTSLLGETYLWNFGDGGTSQAENPAYTWNTPGTFTVSLTVVAVGGGVNSAIKVDSIVVHPRAQAFFTLQPTEVLVPSQPVFTYNLSGNADQFHWDFGDGGTSTELSPAHYYQNAGSNDVTLVANNQWNCPDTFSLPGAVTGLVAGEIQFPNAFTPGNNGPTDGVYDPQSFDNDHFFPVYEGVQDYHLQVFNRWGELVFETFDVHVGWDGYYRGRPAKQDVYAWKAYARFSSGNETTLTGDVTLLR
jgi:gliding motility-associated-like protein